jgi:hypothetical protein
MTTKTFLNPLVLICLAMLPACASTQDLPDPRETQAIANEAYVYGFPMRKLPLLTDMCKLGSPWAPGRVHEEVEG